MRMIYYIVEFDNPRMANFTMIIASFGKYQIVVDSINLYWNKMTLPGNCKNRYIDFVYRKE